MNENNKSITPSVTTPASHEEPDAQIDGSSGEDTNPDISAFSIVFTNAQLPANISGKIQQNILSNPFFILELTAILQSDPYLWILVDKERSLSGNYEPQDLVELNNGSYRINRDDLYLRNAAAASLEEMASAARAEGLVLTASSAYRSYSYQVQLYQRYVNEMGQNAADKISARPGHSQHQLGLVVDFGSIDDSFALTGESRWLTANASRFGWSLSYPQGYEGVTGYSWESWHYRYMGKALAAFIDNYFNGIQQYALRFIHEWIKLN
ncbi:MAG: M15 family metallopeptidase [Treponema sp.]|nr:M15 family metallopeptidase [Treponema sp.]